MAREMRHSGIEWIGEIPKEWKTCQLKRLLSFQNGQDYKHVESDNGYPVYGSGGIFKFATDYLYDGESVLFGRKGTIDKPLFVKGKFWTVDTMYYAIPFNGNDTKYLYYLATLLPFDKYQTSTALPSMTQTILGNMNVVYPPLCEQHKIANYLDKVCGEVDEIIALQEQMIEELKAYKQSVITEAVTKGLNPDVSMKDSGSLWIGNIPMYWNIGRIGDIGDYKKGPFGSAITLDMFIPKGKNTIKVYEQQNAIKKDWKLGYYYISEDYFIKKLQGFEVLPNDLIVSCAGTIGEVYQLPLDIERGIINQALMRMRIKDSINLSYFLYIFDLILKGEADRSSNGTAIKNIPPFSVFKKILIPLPPLEEQQSIASYLDTKCAEIDALIAIKQAKIEELKDYKKSVIYEYVTGKKEVV